MAFHVKSISGTGLLQQQFICKAFICGPVFYEQSTCIVFLLSHVLQAKYSYQQLHHMCYPGVPQCSGGNGLTSTDSDCGNKQQSLPVKHSLCVFLEHHTTSKCTTACQFMPKCCIAYGQPQLTSLLQLPTYTAQSEDKSQTQSL